MRDPPKALARSAARRAQYDQRDDAQHVRVAEPAVPEDAEAGQQVSRPPEDTAPAALLVEISLSRASRRIRRRRDQADGVWNVPRA